jgi:colanic acid biosynthesis glycosyl transferase WcaI
LPFPGDNDVKVLFLNRVYPPDRGATGFFLADLARALVSRGWDITVLAGRVTGSPASEIIQGVRVERVGPAGPVHAHPWRRMLSHLNLYPSLLWRAWRLPSSDVVVTLTDPPLLLLLGPILKWMKGSRLVHWTHDLYPEIAEELGVVRKNGMFARLCRRVSTWAMRRHDSIIVVGRCLKKRLMERGVTEEAIRFVPNWSPAFLPIARADNPFRREHGLEGRFVVMYSGNFGRPHSFEAILDAAQLLQTGEQSILFLLVGDGVQLEWIRARTRMLALDRVRFLPALPAESLPQSLSAADLHLVSMQPGLGGLLVPSKIYGVLAAGRPCLFLGPRESEAAQTIEHYQCGSVMENPDGSRLAHEITAWMKDPERQRIAGRNARAAASNFTVERAAAAFRKILGQTATTVSLNEGDPQQIPSKTQT